MTYQSSPVGNEISCVMHGLSADKLNDTNQLEKILLDALKKDNFNIIKKMSHSFKPQGYTITVLLAESHTAIHTYPEFSSLYFNLYSCRGRNDGRKTLEYLKKVLNPSYINLNERPIIVEEIIKKQDP